MARGWRWWLAGRGLLAEESRAGRACDEGLWEHGSEDRHLDLVRSMRMGDRIAIEQRLEQLNSTFAADSRLGKAFRICHSDVTPSHDLERRSSRDWFAEVVATELRPLLHEDLFDAPDVAEREADRLLEGW
jgi:hypothetical protein